MISIFVDPNGGFGNRMTAVIPPQPAPSPNFTQAVPQIPQDKKLPEQFWTEWIFETLKFDGQPMLITRLVNATVTWGNFTVRAERETTDKVAAIERLENLLATNLVIKEWALPGAVTDLGLGFTIASLNQRDFRPEVVILDGLSTAVSRAVSRNLSQPPRCPDLRAYYEKAIQRFLEFAKKSNCAILVTAQANKAKAARVRAVQKTMLQDVPQLFTHFRGELGFIGISSLRTEGERQLEQYLNVGRTANGPGGLVPVRAEFEYQRFGEPCAF